LQIIGGQNNVAGYVVQAFNMFESKRTMILTKDVIEVQWIAVDLNVIASETEVYKNASFDFKNYRTMEHIIGGAESLLGNQNFKCNLENLYSLKV